MARNPNFKSWNADVRPDGVPDEIVFTSGVATADRLPIIERDEADYTSLTGADPITPEVMADLRTQYPGQLRASSNTTFALYLTAKPPFDKLEARQALSMAIDRAHASDLYGGGLSAAITCQGLPPGIFGYEPYCPFTLDPDAGGRWHGPDLDAARRLIDESGTRGAKIVVGPVLPRWAKVRDYVAEVLSGLGYDTTVDTRTDGDAFFGALDSGEFQLSMGTSTATYPAPTEHLLSFTCSLLQPGLICDPALDELFDRAVELQATDVPAAAVQWAAVDRYITDRSYWVPLVNPGVGFVSSRLGNYQYSPAYRVLWDQLWVQ
jgi:peptide/nickel transport system substrate-binding protein